MRDLLSDPTPPSVEGLIWQSITPDDLAALVELAEECRMADGGLGFLNRPDNLKERYFLDAPGAAIGAFAADGRLVACATVHVARDPNRERAVLVGQVRPDLRNRGIGAFLMRWSQVQAQTLFSAGPVEERVLQVATESLTDSAQRLYRAHGFEPVMEELVMRRDLRLPLPERPLPPGVTIRSWQPDLSGQVFQAYTASFRDRPGFPGWSAEEWLAWTIDENHRPEWSLLARAGDVPVGFVTAGSEHPGGFVVQVGVIPEHRRRGLGSALMVETMRRMQAAGEVSAQLAVGLNNPGAIQAYARLGFAGAGRRARYRRSVER